MAGWRVIFFVVVLVKTESTAKERGVHDKDDDLNGPQTWNLPTMEDVPRIKRLVETNAEDIDGVTANNNVATTAPHSFGIVAPTIHT